MSEEKIPTAEETLIQACRDAGFTEDYSRMIFRINPDSSSAFVEAIVSFAKLHVEAALKAASEQAMVDGEKYFGVVKESILEAYPPENIK